MRDRIGGNKYSTLRQRLVQGTVWVRLVRTRRDLVRVGRDRGVGFRIAEMDGGGISRGWGTYPVEGGARKAGGRSLRWGWVAFGVFPIRLVASR